MQELLDRTGYTLDVTTGQRRYGGPPPKHVYDGEEPGPGCQVSCGSVIMLCGKIFNFSTCDIIFDLFLLI